MEKALPKFPTSSVMIGAFTFADKDNQERTQAGRDLVQMGVRVWQVKIKDTDPLIMFSPFKQMRNYKEWTQFCSSIRREAIMPLSVQQVFERAKDQWNTMMQTAIDDGFLEKPPHCTQKCACTKGTNRGNIQQHHPQDWVQTATSQRQLSPYSSITSPSV